MRSSEGIATEIDKGLEQVCLRVLLFDEEDGITLQGLELDHSACGDSEGEAKEEFRTGLAQVLKQYGVGSGGLQVADQDEWDYLMLANGKLDVQVEPLTEGERLGPFNAIAYYRIPD